MNKAVTSREAILCAGRELVVEVGLQGLNIRDVAKRCGVSVGSIYNYFPAKSDLTLATIESVWREIMQDLTFPADGDFIGSVRALFLSIQKGSERFPGFLSSHSVSILAQDKSRGRESMTTYFSRIRQTFLAIMDSDRGVREDAFSERLTRADFWDFVMRNIVTLLIQKADSCDILLEIIRRSIY